ncbi:FecR family protein [Chitinophaga skermanii]|uniref:FecR family protein n=1 Tax=Chitinophaga skermanii TaxID=331697 RepID=A0A327QUB8_9BACT|nr:FecR family protein [Chitinophaga skermanii]RAJ08266.1 FecR family protein [Chitinophaga skermanii]
MANEQANDRYEALSRKLLEGTITQEEREELAQWLNDDDGQVLDLPADFVASREAHEARMWKNIAKATQPRTLQRRIRVISAAAAVLLVAVVGYKYLLPSSPTPATQLLANDHLPAGNKAVLTLGNGEEVVLDNMALGSHLDQAVKEDSGRLTYLYASADVAQINSLSTPRGGRFNVTLPDGTNVWLNAASKLTFPTVFNGKERIVELQGQAYFDVTQDANRPFKVKVGTVNVHVLGTSFDIMAYPDEQQIKTTLVTGSVQVQSAKEHTLLHPAQQAVADVTAGTLTVQPANLDKTLAWKNGLFIFNNADLASIVREISRWYDVEFINLAGDSKELYGGSISRKKNLSDVLQLLSAYGSHQFKVEGRKVTILPK